MSNFDTPHNELTASQNWLDTSANIEQSKQEQVSRIAELQNPDLKTLAEKQLQNLQTLEAQKQADAQAITEARTEFKEDMDALILLQSKFWNLEGFANFADFLIEKTLSKNELESFMDFVSQKSGTAKREFRKNGFPTSRQSYIVFAEKLGLPVSSAVQNLQDVNIQKAQNIYLSSLPALKSVQHLPEVAELTTLISDLENLEWAEAQEQMNTILDFLVWPDRLSGKLDDILLALKKQDAENARNGNPTRHFETFTRTVRDFSPEVSRRIDIFLAEYQPETETSFSADAGYKEAIIDAAIPTNSKIETDPQGSIVAHSGDTSEVTISSKGNDLERSLKLQGLDHSVTTPLEHSDFSEAQNSYETVRYDLAPKLEHTEQALAFLSNPKFADTPLVDMQNGLRKTLGYSLYTKLGISGMTDKEQVQTLLETNIADYTAELTNAEKTYQVALDVAVRQSQERYREQDEKIKTTLRAVKHSGLGFLDLSYLTTQISSGFAGIDIGVPVDIQNFDLATGNFWEPASLTDNPTKHIEYIYRTANKILTGNPEGMVGGKLTWFSLEQAILNPDVAQKTDGELKALLLSSGVWNETTGVDKVEMLGELAKPLISKTKGNMTS